MRCLHRSATSIPTRHISSSKSGLFAKTLISASNASNNAIRSVYSTDGSAYFAGFSNSGVFHRTWENGNNSGVTATSVAITNTRRLDQ